MRQRMQFSHEPDNLLERPAESLVVRGLRSWMAGYEFGDIHCWETAWREYSGVLGAQKGRHLLSELQYWVRILRDVSVREISCFPHCCCRICHDECMALSMISGFQYQDRSSAQSAAVYLTGQHSRASLDLLLEASSSYALALAETGNYLLPVPGDVVEDIARRSSSLPGSRSAPH